MEKESKSNKDRYVSRLLIVLAFVLFLVQVCSYYSHLRKDAAHLRRELNLAGSRVDKMYLQKQFRLLSNNIDSLYVVTKDTITAITYDSTNIISPQNVNKINSVAESNLSIPSLIDLTTVDSIAHKSLSNRGINLSVYSEIVNTVSGEVVATTADGQKHFCILTSKSISLNENNSAVLRIILINPYLYSYIYLIIIGLVSLVAYVAMFYCIYYLVRRVSEENESGIFNSDVLSDLSHQYKKPLTSIKMAVSSLDNEKIFTDEDKRSRYFKKLYGEVHKMTAHTEMVLSMSRYEKGVFKLVCKEFDFSKLASGAIERCLDVEDMEPHDSEESPDSAEPRRLRIELDDQLENNIFYGDEAHIEHIITNLIDNAIKYTIPPILIEIKLYEDNKNVYLSVKDNGIGIAKEDIPYIFDRYSRVKQTKVKSTGHGIGLNYVKRIVEKHNGNIKTYSIVDQGTEFLITLPRQKRVED